MPLISIIVPTYNSELNLANFLESFVGSNFSSFEIIVNDDNRTTDKTPALIDKYMGQGLNIIYKRENISMAQARKQGVKYATGQILMHLDSDMSITPWLLGEVEDLIINQNYDGLIIPEEAYGTTFWANCKFVEKKCYENTSVESLRVIKSDIYRSLGGHDEKMVYSEDKDFDIRVKKAGFVIGRTSNHLFHNEGDIRLLKTAKKKLNYASTANLFIAKHPEEFKGSFMRYFIFFRRIDLFFRYPIRYIGMLIMKTTEFSFGAYGIIKKLKNT